MSEENKIAENIENENEQNELQNVENAPETVEESPVAEEIPAVEETPAIEETPIIEEKQTVEETLIAEEKPIVEEIRMPAEVKPLADFNWDEIGKDKQIYSETEHKNLEDLYSQTFKSIIEQDVVDGIVVAKTAREIVVNIGYKSDGVIPANELRHNPNLKIGDVIEVYVEKQEDATGQLVLSHKKARLLKSWNRVNKAFDDGEVINGYIKSKTKGGLIVDVFGIEAFLPGSQIDVKPIRDYDIFVDKTMDFKVVKINQEFKNVVVSHKALIEIELEAQRAEIISGLEKGQVLEGVVKNITNYGAFIDLNGVDGLIHITDLAWGRINHPEEVIQLDQKINVVILDFDEGKKRIALGLKQLTPHPWDSLAPDLKIEDKVSGKVVVVADYGAFIEIHPGVEGLLHVSEMSWSQHLRTAHDFLKVGDVVEAAILTLDRDERKMSLGIKQLIADPWTNIADKYRIGSQHTAIVRNFTTFGIFVELEEGIDGLIHISDLSWSKKIKHPAEFTKIGDKIDVVILEMDIENRRLSLGHKQLEENPWDVYETLYNVGSIHEGTIVGQNDKGMIVSLQGVEGFTFYRGLVKEDNTNLKMGETAEFKVLEFSKENKKIVLSHTRIWQDKLDEEKKRLNTEENKKSKEKTKVTKHISKNSERSTLGDLDALITLKADLESEETDKRAKKAKKVEETEKAPVIENIEKEEIIDVVQEEKEVAPKKTKAGPKKDDASTEKKETKAKTTKTKKEEVVKEVSEKEVEKPKAKKSTKKKDEVVEKVSKEKVEKPKAKKSTAKKTEEVEKKPKEKKAKKTEEDTKK